MEVYHMAAENQERDLAAALRPWTAAASSLVGRRLSDVRQHAAAGYLGTAEMRLTELRESLQRHVANARGYFYRRAFVQHPRDPAVHRLDLGPDADGEHAVRTLPILGRSYVHEIDDLIQDARAGLQSAALAEESSGPDAPYLENWAAEHAERITARVHGELSNSQIAIFEAVGQILVRPEFR
jgi:hypothetical protein